MVSLMSKLPHVVQWYGCLFPSIRESKCRHTRENLGDKLLEGNMAAMATASIIIILKGNNNWEKQADDPERWMKRDINH